MKPKVLIFGCSFSAGRYSCTEQNTEQVHTDVGWYDQLSKDLDYISSKLGLKCEDLKKLVQLPVTEHNAYSTQENLYRLMKKTQGLLEKIFGKKISAYS